MKTFLFGALLLFLALSVKAEVSQVRGIGDRCHSIGGELGGAINAMDWENLKKLSKFSIENCKPPILERNTYFLYYGSLGLAEYELGNYASALKAADYCIGQNYNIAGCHNTRADTLVELKRFPEALREYKVTGRLLVNEIAKLKLRLASDPNELSKSERNAISAEIDMNQAMLNSLLKSGLFSPDEK